MATSNHRVIRGKMIKQGPLLLDSRKDGSVHVKVYPEDGSEAAGIVLTEEDAVLLNQLLDDMIEWTPDKPAEITSP